jgi:hypothetical protein
MWVIKGDTGDVTGENCATAAVIGENCATKNVIISIPQQILVYCDKIKDVKIDGAFSMHRKDIHVIFWL